MIILVAIQWMMRLRIPTRQRNAAMRLFAPLFAISRPLYQMPLWLRRESMPFGRHTRPMAFFEGLTQG